MRTVQGNNALVYVLIRFLPLLLQNILDKFNPGARQLINAGKAYLKALHGECTLIGCLDVFRARICIMTVLNSLQSSFLPVFYPGEIFFGKRIGFIWLWMWASGGLMRILQLSLKFHKSRDFFN